jgi:hypothetical protein
MKGIRLLFWLRITRRSFFSPVSVHNTVYLHSAGFCVVSKLRLLELLLHFACFCVQLNQASPTFAIFWYKVRNMCERSAVNRTFFLLWSNRPRRLWADPLLTFLYHNTDTQIHQVGRPLFRTLPKITGTVALSVTGTVALSVTGTVALSVTGTVALSVTNVTVYNLAIQIAIRFLQLHGSFVFHISINNLTFLLLYEATLLGMWLRIFGQTVRVSFSKG